MTLRTSIHLIGFGAFALWGLSGCKPEEPVNPYASAEPVIVVDSAVIELPAPEPGNFAWIHANVFFPTCSNSGCHDGSFEPDFRTVGSSYNTLVMHPVISNDATGSFSHRVVPGDPMGSLLMKRLLESIPNTSGQMPLEVDEDSDWPEERDQYLEAISTWISDGAPNAAGDLPLADGDVNLPPIVMGFGGFPAGNLQNPFDRDPDAGYALVVEPGLVDLWFALEDAVTPANELAATMQVSGSPGDFSGSEPVSLSWTANAFEAPAFFGQSGVYQHRIELDLTEWIGMETDTVLYLRITLDDGDLMVTTPNASSPTYMTTLYSLIFP